MLWLGLAALGFGLFGLLAYCLPVSLSSNLQARAEPSGNWVLALGMAVGPVAFSAIAANFSSATSRCSRVSRAPSGSGYPAGDQRMPPSGRGSVLRREAMHQSATCDLAEEDQGS